MKESSYKSYDELPLFLNAATVAKVLSVSPSSCYELMHEPTTTSRVQKRHLIFDFFATVPLLMGRERFAVHQFPYFSYCTFSVGNETAEEK